MNEAAVFHILLRVIVAASVLHILLPPYDVLDGFPTAQKYYKVLLAIVAWLALNLRTKLIQAYPSVRAQLPSAEKPDGGAPSGT